MKIAILAISASTLLLVACGETATSASEEVADEVNVEQVGFSRCKDLLGGKTKMRAELVDGTVTIDCTPDGLMTSKRFSRPNNPNFDPNAEPLTFSN